MSRVLTVLGGGSAYAPGLVQALLHHAPGLGLTELRLHDIDQEHLEVVSALAARMTELAGGPFRVVAHPGLEGALSGATVVLNSTRPGGLHARHLDESLPVEFGLPGQETVGPGGFFFALRSVPYTLEVAERLRTLSPDAVLLNYTNPTNIVSQALADRVELRCLGLCDQSDEDLETLAKAARLGGALEFECVGLNHATWYSQLRGADGRRLRVPSSLGPPAGLDEEHQLRFTLSLELSLRAPGGWPNSYLPYYTHPEAFVAMARRRGSRAAIIEASLPDYYRHFREEAAREVPRLERHRGTRGFGDLAVRTLLALWGESPRRLVLNVPSRGSAPLFQQDTVIEVPIQLGATLLHRHPVEAPPAFLRPLLERLEHYQRAAAEVAAGPAPVPLLAEALAENPLVPDRRAALALVERALAAYGSLLSEGGA